MIVRIALLTTLSEPFIHYYESVLYSIMARYSRFNIRWWYSSDFVDPDSVIRSPDETQKMNCFVGKVPLYLKALIPMTNLHENVFNIATLLLLIISISKFAMFFRNVKMSVYIVMVTIFDLWRSHTNVVSSLLSFLSTIFLLGDYYYCQVIFVSECSIK